MFQGEKDSAASSTFVLFVFVCLFKCALGVFSCKSALTCCVPWGRWTYGVPGLLLNQTRGAWRISSRVAGIRGSKVLPVLGPGREFFNDRDNSGRDCYHWRGIFGRECSHQCEICGCEVPCGCESPGRESSQSYGNAGRELSHTSGNIRVGSFSASDGIRFSKQRPNSNTSRFCCLSLWRTPNSPH